MNLKASDIMTQPVVAVNEAAPVKDLIQLLNEKSISGVPVVDDEGGLVGVISITDLLAANIGEIDIAARRVLQHRVHQHCFLGPLASYFGLERLSGKPRKTVGVGADADIAKDLDKL